VSGLNQRCNDLAVKSQKVNQESLHSFAYTLILVQEMSPPSSSKGEMTSMRECCAGKLP
jgi:hypothetical protein